MKNMFEFLKRLFNLEEDEINIAIEEILLGDNDNDD